MKLITSEKEINQTAGNNDFVEKVSKVLSRSAV